MNQAEFERAFRLPFDEAAQWFLDKLDIPTSHWDELDGAAHAKAFASAGAIQADLLSDLRALTEGAIAGGMDIREFRRQFRPLVGKYGWQLQGGGPGWRSDLIWRTNIQSAYQAGRWQQFEEAGISHLKYVHNDSVRHPRPNHVAMDGTVLPRTDPFWSVNYPPNGFGCKCRAVPATREEIAAAGDTPRRPGDWETLPDAGWNANVGDKRRGYRALAAKFESLPNDIARVWMQRFVQEPAFQRFVAGEIKEDFPVAVLRPEDMATLGARKQSVWMSAETMAAHLGKHPEIGIDDYRLLPEIIDQGEVYARGATRLIYLWRNSRLYRAAVKVTRDKAENFVLTLFAMEDPLADKQVRKRWPRER